MKTVILAITLMLGLGMVSCGSSADIDITERLTFEQKNAIEKEFPELTKEHMEILGSIYSETKNYPYKGYLKGITYYDFIEVVLFYQSDLYLELVKIWEKESDASGIEKLSEKYIFIMSREEDYISVNFPNFFRLSEIRKF